MIIPSPLYVAVNVVHLPAYVKVNVHLRTGHEVAEGEQMYSSTLPSTSALDGGGWSTPDPGPFTPGKDPVPTFWLGGHQGRSGRVRKISIPPGFDPQTGQLAASHDTDCAIPAHFLNFLYNKAVLD